VLSHPEAVAVSADGERVYVGDYWSRPVAVISVPMLPDFAQQHLRPHVVGAIGAARRPVVVDHPRTRRLNPIARLPA
jgi:hypothetical protein